METMETLEIQQGIFAMLGAVNRAKNEIGRLEETLRMKPEDRETELVDLRHNQGKIFEWKDERLKRVNDQTPKNFVTDVEIKMVLKLEQLELETIGRIRTGIKEIEGLEKELCVQNSLQETWIEIIQTGTKGNAHEDLKLYHAKEFTKWLCEKYKKLKERAIRLNALKEVRALVEQYAQHPEIEKRPWLKEVTIHDDEFLIKLSENIRNFFPQ